MRSPINRHSIWQIAADSALVALAWWLAWILRFDEARPVYYDRYLDVTIIALVVAIKLPVFVFCGFYTRWWRYVSTRDMWTVVRGVVLASIAVFLVFTLFDVHRAAVPRGVWAMAHRAVGGVVDERPQRVAGAARTWSWSGQATPGSS